MNARPHIHSGSSALRRGNTIVLVIGILVLLVIIATAFVVRTQAGRQTAGAQQSSELRGDNARNIAGDLANEISGAALFVRAVDTSALTGGALSLDSNTARLAVSPLALRYEADTTDVFTGVTLGANGLADFPYNAQPYQVVPWTNWPDFLPGGLGGPNINWPAGVGNQHSVPPNSQLRGEDNPLGFPGFGDARWLRDLEPLRWDTDNDGVLDAFSHWRHMTNIARPDNGWRAVFDITDIGDVDGNGYGLIATNLNVPFEQFLPLNHAYLSVRGDTNLASVGLQTFVDLWGNWMGVSPLGLDGYMNALQTPGSIPPNLLRLGDLDADGIQNEDGERPQDEFLGPGLSTTYPLGTPRWFVSRVLADADGDGYTDSFWFLAPTPVQAGIRTVVAVSVIDNQGMLDVNSATRFIRADPTGVPQKTGGLTPTDLALTGQGTAIGNGNFNIGWYDTWESWLLQNKYPVVPFVAAANRPEFNSSYDTNLTAANNLWFRHLTEVGLTNNAGVPLDFPNTATRLDYWRRSASQPLSVDPLSRYTPFGLADELELRMYAGQNYPWIASRLEFSASNNINGSGSSPYRANLNREESSEFIDQLFNQGLVLDLRHRTTAYNGARNDIAQPWLWMYGPNKDFDFPGNGVNAGDRDLDRDGTTGDIDDMLLFQAGARKFDLRIPYDDPAGHRVYLPGSWDANPGFELWTNDRIPAPNTDWRIGIALRDRLTNALMDNLDNLPSNRGSYYGLSLAQNDQTRELAAAYAANIAQWRDREDFGADVTSHELSRLDEAVPVAPSASTPAPNARFMGMEPQPFIVEAFIGHVYSDIGTTVTALDANGTPYNNAGQHVVTEDASRRSTVIAVQIANPYNRPINLDDPNCQFQVRVFGQEFDLGGLGLGSLLPATEDRPATLILYAVKDDLNGDTAFPDKWVDFLDIANSDHPSGASGSIIIRVPTSRWDVESRTTYDTDSVASAVDIRRRDPVTSQWVIIDRIDPPNSRRFGDAVNQLGTPGLKPEDDPGAPPLTYDGSDDPAGYPYPGHNIGVDASGYNHWVQWVRATRAWGVDVNNDGEVDPNEVNPRYVFGDYAVASAAGAAAVVDDALNTGTVVYGGNRYKYADAPDSPWFTRPYIREEPLPAPAGTNLQVDTRKPTFFNFNHQPVDPITGGDPAYPNWSFPDKGWYGQKGTGTPDDEVIVPPTPPATNGERTYRTPFAFQMLHADRDFQQVGELLNVFLYGHKLEFTGAAFSGNTLTTFSEYLSQASDALTGYQDPNLRYRVNRLLLSPNSNGGLMGQYVGVGDPTDPEDPRHAIPDLPAGIRVLDTFVCDGFGCEPLIDVNGSGSTLDEAEGRTLFNAKGFDGSATPGLVNINTAPMEVIRCLPHMMRLVHETGGVSPAVPYYNNAGQPLVTTAPNPAAALPRVMVPEAMVQARERFNGFNPISAPNPTGMPGGPDYEGLAGPRGFSGIGEVLMLNRNGVGQNSPPAFTPTYIDRVTSNTTDRIYDEQWRIDMDVAGVPTTVNVLPSPKPFLDLPGAGADQVSMRVSIDRQDVFDPFAATAGDTRPDYVAGDVEEANALFAGISNMITTRSDVFTVYFKVRTFRQNTSVSPPRWDATNAEYIIDDSRYVMLVDRSGVNKPGDQPKILYLEKLPN